MTTEKRIGIGISLAALVMAAAPESQAQTATFTPLEDGHIYVVDGIAAAEAIAQSEGGGAFVDVIVEQVAAGNTVIEENVLRTTVFENAGQNSVGILLFNQEAGNMNNQANVVVVALGQDAPVQLADIMGTQILTDNMAVSSGARETRISNAFNDTTGIVAINQSAGNLNQQVNILAMAMGETAGPDIVALADTTLDNVSPGTNELVEDGVSPRKAYLTDSFTNFKGIGQVSMSAGDQNRIANAVSLSVVVMTIE